MATVVNMACANCFNQRTQLPADCTLLHSTEQSEDMSLRKGPRLQWMGPTMTQAQQLRANSVWHQGFWLPKRPHNLPENTQLLQHQVRKNV